MSNAILPKSKFIHIPKCGGTAIQSVLWRVGCIRDKSQGFTEPHFGHLYASQMPEDNRTNFAFVRNPVTWWHSWYWWNKTQALSRFNGQELKTESFDEWINDYGQFWLGMYTTMIKRYLGEDKNFPTTNKVELIGKVEHLFTDLKTILDEIGEQYDVQALDDIINKKIILPKNHLNSQSYERGVIADSTKKIILQTEHEIFTRFGYGLPK
jgi:hypothetical protein